MSERLLAVGADGARGGWVAALGYGSGERFDRVELRLVGDFSALASLHTGDVPLAVDIPMGLTETVVLRPCDQQARKLLGARAATIFAPPSRALLAAGSYGEARALIARERTTTPTAKGLSAQAFGLVAKIREADAYLQAQPNAQDWLWECHPELAFRAMTGGAVSADKKSVGGQAERVALLADRVPAVLDALRAFPVARRQAQLDDALDALACLETARRIRAGIHEQLGGESDATGLRMRIVL